MSAKTLYDKLWDAHLVQQRDDGSALIYIDRHIIHEVTSPQAVGSSRVDLQACKLEYSIVSPK